MRPLDRYEKQNAAEKIESYLSARPLEPIATALERARKECLVHLRRQIECIEAMPIDQILPTLRKTEAELPNGSTNADTAKMIEQLEDALYHVGMDLEMLGLNTDDIKEALGDDGIKRVEKRAQQAKKGDD